MALFNDYMIVREFGFWSRQDAQQFLRQTGADSGGPGTRPIRSTGSTNAWRKYSPEQPRDRDGRWTGEGGAAKANEACPNRTVDVQNVLAKARRSVPLVGMATKNASTFVCPCWKDFSPLEVIAIGLELHKCMGACVGR